MPEIPLPAVYNVPGQSRTDGNMDIFSTFAFIVVIAYIGFTMYLANQAKATGEPSSLLRWLLYGIVILTFFYGLFVLQTPFIPQSAGLSLPQVNLTAAVVNFALSTVLSLLSAQIVASASFRQRIRNRLPMQVSYDPDSPVHTAAWALMAALVSITIGNFVVGGGITGLAQSIETNGIGFGDILFENVLWVAAAALGAGLFIRRTPQQALTRLGLRLPTRQDFNQGVGIGLLLLLVVFGVSALWTRLVSPQELQQQTAASDQFALAFNSLPLALVISLVVAVGEETFFRGALQPVFGNWLTSIFFAVLHTQYTLTPATILILITSLALGWLRQRQSTSASIIGHFVYNFVQLALAALLGASV